MQNQELAVEVSNQAALKAVALRAVLQSLPLVDLNLEAFQPLNHLRKAPVNLQEALAAQVPLNPLLVDLSQEATVRQKLSLEAQVPKAHQEAAPIVPHHLAATLEEQKEAFYQYLSLSHGVVQDSIALRTEATIAGQDI